MILPVAGRLSLEKWFLFGGIHAGPLVRNRNCLHYIEGIRHPVKANALYFGWVVPSQPFRIFKEDKWRMIGKGGSLYENA
jgi:hypothetical protein